MRRVNELQVPYTEARDFLAAVRYTVFCTITDLFVDLKGLLDDQMRVVAPYAVHHHWYVPVVEVGQVALLMSTPSVCPCELIMVTALFFSFVNGLLADGAVCSILEIHHVLC